jgi:Acyl-CoA thioesterase C-terminal domain/Acyl-CoA thioesterase N-terminal domain
VTEAFFEPDGEAFVPTELTRGPWDPDAQHAGPPAALLGREIERHSANGEGSPDARVGRVTYEILRSVPLARLTVATEVIRPGRRVELVESRLSDDEGEVMRATAWLLRPDAVDLPPGLVSDSAPPGPDAGEPKPFFDTGQSVGYHTAMEYRFVAGGFVELGPATVWMRMRHPLVLGEQPTPLQRVLVAADSGNGVSATLDWRRYLFINVDLTVQLHRLPAGEWVCLDAITIPEASGVGLADTALYDERAAIGRATQTLLVAER